MGKFNKLYYYTKEGKKLNCYSVSVSKIMAEKAGITEDDELDVSIKGNEIVIKKKEGNKDEV